MKFTLIIDTDYNDIAVKDECMEAVANVLNSKGKPFDVGYNPNEVQVKGRC